MQVRAGAVVGACLFAWLHAGASEGRTPQRVSPGSVRPRPAAQAPAAVARISGFVITRDEPPKPVKQAIVRVRDGSGRIVGTVTTDDTGHFTVALDRAGSYYVEMVDKAGNVLAVEDVGQVTVSVTAGQNSTTILRVPGKLAGAAWGSTAKTIVGAASAAGVGAFVAGGQAASPER